MNKKFKKGLIETTEVCIKIEGKEGRVEKCDGKSHALNYIFA